MHYIATSHNWYIRFYALLLHTFIFLASIIAISHPLTDHVLRTQLRHNINGRRAGQAVRAGCAAAIMKEQ
jgi:hypothetical protein